MVPRELPLLTGNLPACWPDTKVQENLLLALKEVAYYFEWNGAQGGGARRFRSKASSLAERERFISELGTSRPVYYKHWNRDYTGACYRKRELVPRGLPHLNGTNLGCWPDTKVQENLLLALKEC